MEWTEAHVICAPSDQMHIIAHHINNVSGVFYLLCRYGIYHKDIDLLILFSVFLLTGTKGSLKLFSISP